MSKKIRNEEIASAMDSLRAQVVSPGHAAAVEHLASAAALLAAAAKADDLPCMAAFHREDQAAQVALVRLLAAPTTSAFSSALYLVDWTEFERATNEFLHAARSRHLAKHYAEVEAMRDTRPIKVEVP